MLKKLMHPYLVVAVLTVAMLGLGVASLVLATDIWRQVVVSGIMLMFGTGAIAAIASAGRRRKMAASFALCGWVYLAAALNPSLGMNDNLATCWPVDWLLQTVHPPDTTAAMAASMPVRLNAVNFTQFTSVSGATGGRFLMTAPRAAGQRALNIRSTAHAMLALLIACAAAFTMRWLTPVVANQPTDEPAADNSGAAGPAVEPADETEENA